MRKATMVRLLEQFKVTGDVKQFLEDLESLGMELEE